MKKVELTDIFDYTKTVKKDYNKILNPTVIGVKGRPMGKVVLLSPEVALKNSYAKTDVTKEAVKHPKFKPEDINPKWALPIIDTLAGRGAGRGRMLLCRHWKLKEMPVLIVARSENDIKKWVDKAEGKKDGKKDKE